MNAEIRVDADQAGVERGQSCLSRQPKEMRWALTWVFAARPWGKPAAFALPEVHLSAYPRRPLPVLNLLDLHCLRRYTAPPRYASDDCGSATMGRDILGSAVTNSSIRAYCDKLFTHRISFHKSLHNEQDGRIIAYHKTSANTSPHFFETSLSFQDLAYLPSFTPSANHNFARQPREAVTHLCLHVLREQRIGDDTALQALPNRLVEIIGIFEKGSFEFPRLTLRVGLAFR